MNHPELQEQTYGFSMINCVRMMPSWDQVVFDRIMTRAQTKTIELVPSMILGNDWDQLLLNTYSELPSQLTNVLHKYKVSSIQSLTFGLDINLADPTLSLDTRLQALCLLGQACNCSLFVLGSPAQKKIDSNLGTVEKHSSFFAANCALMARKLGHDCILALEHNTLQQGAQYCNTLNEMRNVVKVVKAKGIGNIGINLDTKCLIQELGTDVSLASLLQDQEISSYIVSVQVSNDFLSRESVNRDIDVCSLIEFTRSRNIPVSLEEFGLFDPDLDLYVMKWREAITAFHVPS